jgi:hypothetical protein
MFTSQPVFELVRCMERELEQRAYVAQDAFAPVRVRTSIRPKTWIARLLGTNMTVERNDA